MDGQWGTICLPFAAKVGNGVTLYEVSGTNLRHTQIYLTEVSEMTPGVPYLFYSENGNANFYGTNGEVITSTSNGNNGLVGVFKSSMGQVKNGSYVLIEDQWSKVDNENEFNLGNYCAYVADLSSVPVITSPSADLKKIVIKNSFLRGDINLDGDVNITDVVALVNKILSPETSDIDFLIDDLNEDDEINITDVIILVDLIIND